jgi:hypothetical protein
VIEQCYDCKYARKYLASWWFPYYDPICEKGNAMNVKEECKEFEQIGRLSR